VTEQGKDQPGVPLEEMTRRRDHWRKKYEELSLSHDRLSELLERKRRENQRLDFMMAKAARELKAAEVSRRVAQMAEHAAQEQATAYARELGALRDRLNTLNTSTTSTENTTEEQS
jgi:hypothetical protein